MIEHHEMRARPPVGPSLDRKGWYVRGLLKHIARMVVGVAVIVALIVVTCIVALAIMGIGNLFPVLASNWQIIVAWILMAGSAYVIGSLFID